MTLVEFLLWFGDGFRRDGKSFTTTPVWYQEKQINKETRKAVRNGFLYRKLVRPILDLLRQGVTPEKMALSVALGAALGVFPALGWSTTLCAIAAIVLKLNLPAIQIVNYFMYPAQIALLVLFFRIGEKLFGAPHFPISVSHIYGMFQASMWSTVQLLWTTIWHAVVVWGMIAPVFVGLLYVILTPVLRRALGGQKRLPA